MRFHQISLYTFFYSAKKCIYTATIPHLLFIHDSTLSELKIAAAVVAAYIIEYRFRSYCENEYINAVFYWLRHIASARRRKARVR